MRTIILVLLIFLFSDIAHATSRVYTTCSKEAAKLMESTPHSTLWRATVLSSLGTGIVYGIDGLTRQTPVPQTSIIALFFSSYAVGYFLGPTICKEAVEERADPISKGEEGFFKKDHLAFPENPEQVHRVAVIKSLVFLGMQLGLSAWVLLDAESPYAKAAIGISMSVPILVALLNLEKFRYQPDLSQTQGSLSPTVLISKEGIAMGLHFEF